jgi:hypothetical protein
MTESQTGARQSLRTVAPAPFEPFGTTPDGWKATAPAAERIGMSDMERLERARSAHYRFPTAQNFKDSYIRLLGELAAKHQVDEMVILNWLNV